MDFQLIVPCYNEAKSLDTIVKRSVEAARDAGYDTSRFQLVIVENGSKDDSQARLKTLGQGEYAGWFKVVTLDPNQGYGGGIWQGLKASEASYIGWTHADEQCDPKDAFDALACLLQSSAPQTTLVKGQRHQRKFLDFAWSRMFEIIVLLLLRVYIWEINAQPKVFSRSLLDKLPNPPTDVAFDLYVLLQARKAGWKIESIPVIFAPRAHGTSRWAFSLKSRLRTGMKMVRYIQTLR